MTTGLPEKITDPRKGFFSDIKEHFSANISRKNFIFFLGYALASLSAIPLLRKSVLGQGSKMLNPRERRPVTTECDLSVIKGNDPGAITRKAVEALGGIERFVKPGDIVVIKPNIAWNYNEEFATNTNPAVVEALVRMCRDAGAKAVKVFDRACINPKISYSVSGIQDAVRRAGGMIYHVTDWKFIPARMSEKAAMNEWPIYRDAVECDCFINVPVAKHHSLAGLTLSIKNLMGVCGGSRGQMHWNISRKLAELTHFIKPDLTVIDCYRILLRHGPSGGRKQDVSLKKTVIAGVDPVLADSYAATLFNKRPHDIGHIKTSAELGVGSSDLSRADIMKLTV